MELQRSVEAMIDAGGTFRDIEDFVEEANATEGEKTEAWLLAFCQAGRDVQRQALRELDQTRHRSLLGWLGGLFRRRQPAVR